MRTGRAFWRRFVESVTVWLNSYRYDPFVRTEIHVIALQVAFGLVMLGLIGTAYSLLYRDISTAILLALHTARETPLEILGPSLISTTDAIRATNFLGLIGAITLVTVLFGYMIAHVTLSPARNALTAQKQFVGNIAHELRTPLSVVKTNTEVALMGSTVSTDMRETLQSNIEELDRISEIINNLLSLSALVRPERMEFAAVDLSGIASAIVQKFSQLARHNEQQITLRKSPDSMVWGNATALTQIVGNLVKNAIVYTPRGGHIRITIEPAPEGHIDLIVQDTGIGIARKDLFRIFEPFYRSDPSRTKGAGGSGLGLAIVSELIKTHQGRITIRSAVGRGTTVSVRFPGSRHMSTVGHEASRRDTLNEIAVDFSS